jgi:putative membrane protein
MNYKMLFVVSAVALAGSSWAEAQAPSSADQAFVMKVGQGGMAEVALGKLAVEKGSNKDIKGFGQRMVDDHGKAGAELKAIAQTKNIPWPDAPSAESKELQDRLSKLTGSAFDRAYIDAMVGAHRGTVATFHTELQSGSDGEIKAWATKTLPTVQAHQAHAEKVQLSIAGNHTTH